MADDTEERTAPEEGKKPGVVGAFEGLPKWAQIGIGLVSVAGAYFGYRALSASAGSTSASGQVSAAPSVGSSGSSGSSGGSSGGSLASPSVAPVPGVGQAIPTAAQSPTINVYVQTPSAPSTSGGTRTTAAPPASTTTTAAKPTSTAKATSGVATSTPYQGYGGSVSNGRAYDVGGAVAATVVNPTNGLTAINLHTYHAPSVTTQQTSVKSGTPAYSVVRYPSTGMSASPVNLHPVSAMRVNPAAVAAVRKAQPRKAVSSTPNRTPVYGNGGGRRYRVMA